MNAPTDQALLQKAINTHSLIPLWEVYEKVVTKAPSADVPSHVWKWRDLAPAMELAVRTVHGRDADHRVLVMRNPHLAGRVATATNILGAVQCVLPGERTSPHRHTPAAVRIVLEGSGGGTFVDGVRCAMHHGDFIVTPNWTWHCHDNDSAERTVWVDLLDVPLVKHINAVFGDLSSEAGAPSYPTNLATLPDALFAQGGLEAVSERPKVSYTPRFRYAWQDVLALLAAMPPAADGSRSVRYTNPLDGGPVLPTLDAKVVELTRGQPTQRMRSTAGPLCVVIEGEGKSRLGDVVHKWAERDIFTVSEWEWASHEATSEKARVLIVSDAEVRRALGLLREERE